MGQIFLPIFLFFCLTGITLMSKAEIIFDLESSVDYMLSEVFEGLKVEDSEKT